MAQNWTVTVTIVKLNLQKRLVLIPGHTIGQLVMQLIEKLDVSHDWSGCSLWNQEKKIWYVRPRQTIETSGLGNNDHLLFISTHMSIPIIMPDLQQINLSLNMAVPMFAAVKELCNDLGIRRFEELSFMKPVIITKKKEKIERESSKPTSNACVKNKDPKIHELLSKPHFCPNPGAWEYIPKNCPLQTRCLPNTWWLESSKTLMEQDINESSIIMLRYKYYKYFDLNNKLDEVRIVQLFQQCRYSILTEEFECSEEVALNLGAVSWQIYLENSLNSQLSQKLEEIDDIDNALNTLQLSLEGSACITTAETVNDSVVTMDKLSDQMYKSKSLSLNTKKTLLYTLKDSTLTVNSESKKDQESLSYDLIDCEVKPFVNISKNRYIIRLDKVKIKTEITTIEFGTDDEQKFCRWLAACRYSSSGKLLNNSTFNLENKSSELVVSMFKSSHNENDSIINTPKSLDCYLPSNMVRKGKSEELITKIYQYSWSHRNKSMIEAMLFYIETCFTSPEFGQLRFNVKPSSEKSKREEILAISPTKLMRIDPSSRNVIKEWSLNNLENWNINWQTQIMDIKLNDSVYSFASPGIDMKMLHEFIGVNLILSLRKDVNKPFNEEEFKKLIGDTD